jgi:hypothetical protein
MWPGFDPEFVRQLGVIRQMVTLRYPVADARMAAGFREDRDELLVEREWPDGSLTSYLTSEHSDETEKLT